LLTIRLSRAGKRNSPHFKVVVAEHTAPIKSKFVEIIGYYNPITQPNVFKIDQKRFEYWLKQGAGLSDTIARLANKQKIAGAEKFIKSYTKKKKKKAEEVAPAGSSAVEQKK